VTPFSRPYTVRSHEHVDADWVLVTLRCLGFPTKGTQPAVWPFEVKVPRSELHKWPLGAMGRLEVTFS
jgi:hypothetical protein